MAAHLLGNGGSAQVLLKFKRPNELVSNNIMPNMNQRNSSENVFPWMHENY
jgi:hypothetical protein